MSTILKNLVYISLLETRFRNIAFRVTPTWQSQKKKRKRERRYNVKGNIEKIPHDKTCGRRHSFVAHPNVEQRWDINAEKSQVAHTYVLSPGRHMRDRSCNCIYVCTEPSTVADTISRCTGKHTGTSEFRATFHVEI